jgi:crossover junction endodeoxyribonuclease RusA
MTDTKILAGYLTATKQIFIPGEPVPQGSMKGYVRNGHANLTSDNKKTMPWRADVAAVVRYGIGSTVVFPDGPVSLALTFVMPRRKAEPKRLTPPHCRKPDLDKLTRAVLDALTGILYTDDSQVVAFHHLEKYTAAIGEQPGLHLGWAKA